MGRIQLGLKLTDTETQEILDFLKALKGRKPDISYPQLPASTEDTPQPDFD